MKRALLLSIALLFVAALSVGTENTLDNQEASLQCSTVVNSDYFVVSVADYRVDMGWSPTGEIIPEEAPVAIYQDIELPVETNPPIIADEIVLINYRLNNANLGLGNQSFEDHAVKYRWRTYSYLA